MKEWLSLNTKEWPIKCKMCDNLVKWNPQGGSFRIYCGPECAKSDKKSQLDKASFTKMSNRKLVIEDIDNTPSRLSTQYKQDRFIRKAIAVHGDEYDYSMVEYSSPDTPVIIICSLHGAFTQSPNAHINQSCGCRLCARLKQKDNCMMQYGVDHHFKDSRCREKIKQTNLERHGHENPLGSPIIKEKRKSTNLDKHGTEYHTQKHMIAILPLLNNPEWLSDQYITQNKTIVQIASELGISGFAIGLYLRKAGIEIKLNYSQSYKANQWLDSLGIHIREYQYHPTNKRLKSDGYCPLTNTIYEFNGDRWHGNPETQPQDKIFHGDITFGDKYRNTIEREEEILSLGYNLVVMWESGSTYKYTHELEITT
jgi:hypothetical protein